MDKKTLVFIPMYNCEAQIGRVLSKFSKDVMEVISEIIVVNNRSTDNSEQVVLNFKNENPEIPIRLTEVNDKQE